ncbi:hypothetical protein T07_8595 [Trichinella nelsoni]|uniref:Uncharacterized protein n=1 Tax=Trichinella nelsoni TaxID=6336 RepID=A0A0V0SHS7_9BILA|nr:hypothetical protein T07_8595 [Trichinella nelsoni]
MRPELTSLFVQTTKRKKDEATVSGFGLEDQRRNMVGRGWKWAWLPLVRKACCGVSWAVLVLRSRKNGKQRQAEMTALGNPPVDTGSSSLSDECANSAITEVNEPARESGSLHDCLVSSAIQNSNALEIICIVITVHGTLLNDFLVGAMSREPNRALQDNQFKDTLNL